MTKLTSFDCTTCDMIQMAPFMTFIEIHSADGCRKPQSGNGRHGFSD